MKNEKIFSQITDLILSDDVDCDICSDCALNGLCCTLKKGG